MNIWTIPSNKPFLTSLIDGLMERCGSDLEEFAKMQILLPSRRACKNLKDTLLNYFDGQLLLMPDIRALGDLDLDELNLKANDAQTASILASIKPTIDPVRRQCILASMIISKTDLAPNHEQALMLASALGRFLDDMTTEGVSFEDLKNIVPDQYANHWQKTLTFLNILNEEWPTWLDEYGLIETAQKRNLLLEAWANLMQESPPKNPVFIAGVTGTIPAAAKLMRVVANLDYCGVILPNVDLNIDEASWNSMEADHPQHGFKTLFKALEITPQDIKIWGGDKDTLSQISPILREMNRPADTSDEWFHLNKDTFKEIKALEKINLIEADDELEEAKLISIATRRALENPKKTVAIITANRNLARHVSSKMKRWGLDLDDSAGIPLHQTALGRWLLLIAEAAAKPKDEALLLSAMKHHLSIADNRFELLKEVSHYEIDVLRAPKKYDETPSISEDDFPHIQKFKSALAEFNATLGKQDISFDALLIEHLKMAEALGPYKILEDEEKQSLLWRGDDGECAAQFLSRFLTTMKNLNQSAHPKLKQTKSYTTILRHFMSGVSVRSKFGTHPRVQILGLMESRLVDADLFILCGLNEGMWPPAPPSDPFLSRHMRLSAGLPSPDKMIGLAAHDFVSKLDSDQEVLITRSSKQGSNPASPSRWLVRLKAILEKLEIQLEPDHELIHFAQKIDEPTEIVPAVRPAPKPPLSIRENRFSASDVSLWMRDPYALYAKKFLKLKKLDPLNRDISFSDRGQFIHACMEEWVKENSDYLGTNPLENLLKIGQKLLPIYCPDEAVRPFWWNRFEDIAEVVVAYEFNWRQKYKPIIIEEFGHWKLQVESPDGQKQSVEFYAKPDRIDISRNNDDLAVIDYKSGSVPSKTDVKDGFEPQLPLEALIAMNGGYKLGANDNKDIPVGALSYWVLSRADKFKSDPVPSVKSKIKLPELLEQAEIGIINLMTAFMDENMPFHAIPDENKAPTYNDYDHLSRFQEWGQG